VKLTCVVGTRPNFVKASALHWIFQQKANVTFDLVHTGQHYDTSLDALLFEQLELPLPKHRLAASSGSTVHQLAEMMSGLDQVWQSERPDVVIVVGDTNSTLAGALSAQKCGIPVAHVEAGLRSGDRTMPEEINRILTDQLSEWLFVSEDSGLKNLEKEGFSNKKVYFVGNCMIDTLLRFQGKNQVQSNLLPKLSSGNYFLLTIHRPSNVDHEAALLRMITWVEGMLALRPVVFPLHPRTRKQLIQFNLYNRLAELPNLYLIEPVGYMEFVHLLQHSAAVITDSGGVQEESTWLGVPCATLRDTTERPVTISLGTNVLIQDLSPATLIHQLQHWPSNIKKTPPPLWDGRTGERIADILLA
jgi:UDP-N-acetylglucosamine 2-epimerase (non-hydrolysing)